ncbi:MAG: GNAT family N-acetyltransferase [Nitrospiraceae bacterium]|nr:GNAT family N-acetyltransferase [Nitrospiraceae bacterium]
MPDNIVIKEVLSKRDIDAFINIPFHIYKDDKFYVHELVRDLKVHYSAKNPFFCTSDVKFYVAYKDALPAGRIVSIVNRDHLEFHKDSTGFFGLFESINDPDVARLLLDQAAADLKKASLKKMVGPMNMSTNEQCGFLIEGFDIHPMLMTPYNPSYYNELMLKSGLIKSQDLLAFIHQLQETLPDKVMRVAAIADKKGFKTRFISKKDFIRDMMTFKNIYNEAWHDNWCFVPITDDELLYSAGRLKQIVVPEFVAIIEKDGEPAGFFGMVPDVNEVLKQMKARLNPWTILKALWYSRKISGLRVLLLGVRPEHRNKGVEALMFRECHRHINQKQYKQIEFSWIVDGNTPIINTIETIGCRLYKRYRMYEREIS